MELGSPFDRKKILKYLIPFIEKGWGSYKELIELTIKDLLEIEVALISKKQEEELTNILG